MKHTVSRTDSHGIALAILAAALYAINAPFSKLLLNHMPPTLMAGFLYLGAGLGMLLIAPLRRLRRARPSETGTEPTPDNPLSRPLRRARPSGAGTEPTPDNPLSRPLRHARPSGAGTEPTPDNPLSRPLRRLRHARPSGADTEPTPDNPLSRPLLPYTLAMIALDIAAPILLLAGLNRTTAANASLLNNFEIVATALIALCVFRERISPRLWAGILFVTLSCALLSPEQLPSAANLSDFRFSVGSLFVLLACICWGIENNCTRRLSFCDPLSIVLLKGIFSGTTSVVIGLVIGERPAAWWSIPAVLCVGFVAYGLSIFFYVCAQRTLGAARTGAYYAIAPFIGTALSLLIFRTMPPYTYFAALLLMAVGAWLAARD